MADIEVMLMKVANDAPSNMSRLREACLNVVGKVRACLKVGTAIDWDLTSSVDMEAFQMCCASRNAVFAAAGLHCLRSVFAGGIAGRRGDGSGDDGRLTLVVDIITSTYKSLAASTTIESEAVQTAAALVDAMQYDIHGDTLMRLVHLYTSIYMRTRHGPNITLAKSALQQCVWGLTTLLDTRPVAKATQQPSAPLLDAIDDDDTINALPPALLNATSSTIKTASPATTTKKEDNNADEWATLFMSEPSDKNEGTTAKKDGSPHGAGHQKQQQQSTQSESNSASAAWEAYSRDLWNVDGGSSSSSSRSGHKSSSVVGPSTATAGSTAASPPSDGPYVAVVRKDTILILRHLFMLASRCSRALDELTVEDVRANAISLDTLQPLLRGIRHHLGVHDDETVDALARFACRAIGANTSLVTRNSLRRFSGCFMLLQGTWGARLRGPLAAAAEEVLLNPLHDDQSYEYVAIDVLRTITQLFADRESFLSLVFGGSSGAEAAQQQGQHTSLAQRIMAGVTRCALSTVDGEILHHCQLAYVQAMKMIQILHRSLLEGKSWAVMLNLRFCRPPKLGEASISSVVDAMPVTLQCHEFLALEPFEKVVALMPSLLDSPSHRDVENILLSVTSFVFQHRRTRGADGQELFSAAKGGAASDDILAFTEAAAVAAREAAANAVSASTAAADAEMTGDGTAGEGEVPLPPHLRDPEAFYNYMYVMLSFTFAYHGHQDNTVSKSVSCSSFVDTCLRWCIIRDVPFERAWAEQQYERCCRHDFISACGFEPVVHASCGLNELMQHQMSVFPRAYPDLDAISASSLSAGSWTKDLAAERLGVPTLLARARSMLQQSWRPAMQVFTLRLGNTSSALEVTTCLEGMRRAAYIASVVCMERERDMLVEALLRSALQGRAHDEVIEMLDCRVVHVVNSLLCIGLEQGGFLRNQAWYVVLRALSLLERSRVRAELQVAADQQRGDSTMARARRLVLPPVSGDRAVALRLISTDRFRAKVNGLFQQSVSLNGQALLAFLRALCRVTMEELSDPLQFLLSARRLCEVLELNTNPEIRSNFDMGAMWRTCGDMVARVGAHNDVKMGLYVSQRLSACLTTYVEAEKRSVVESHKPTKNNGAMGMKTASSTSAALNLPVDPTVSTASLLQGLDLGEAKAQPQPEQQALEEEGGAEAKKEADAKMEVEDSAEFFPDISADPGGERPWAERVSMQAVLLRTLGRLMARTPLAAVRSATARTLTTHVFHYAASMTRSAWREIFFACSNMCNVKAGVLTEEAIMEPSSAEATEMREVTTVFDVYRVAVEKDAFVLRALARDCIRSLLLFCAESKDRLDTSEAVVCLKLITGRLAGLHHKRRRKRQDQLAVRGQLVMRNDTSSLKNNEFDQFGDYEGEEEGGLDMWWDLLENMTRTARSCPVDTQARVLDALFATIRETCPLFTREFCVRLVCEALIPLAYRLLYAAKGDDDNNTDGSSTKNSLKSASSCDANFKHVLCLLADLFSDFHLNLPGGVTDDLIGAMISLLVAAIRVDREVVAKAGISSLRHLVSKNGASLTEAGWGHVIRAVMSLLEQTIPRHVLGWTRATMQRNYRTARTRLLCDRVFFVDERQRAPTDVHEMAAQGQLWDRPAAFTQLRETESDFHHVVIRIEVLQLLLDFVREAMVTDTWGMYEAVCVAEGVQPLLRAAAECGEFARSFNTNKALRQNFVDSGLTRHVPSLIMFEASSTSCVVQVVSRVWQDREGKRAGTERVEAKGQLLALLRAAVARHGELVSSGTGGGGDAPMVVQAWEDVLRKDVMPILLGMSDEKFIELMPALFGLVAQLVSARDTLLRESVQLYLVRAGTLGGLGSQ